MFLYIFTHSFLSNLSEVRKGLLFCLKILQTLFSWYFWDLGGPYLFFKYKQLFPLVFNSNVYIYAWCIRMCEGKLLWMRRFAVPGRTQVSFVLKESMLLHNYRTVNSGRFHFLVHCWWWLPLVPLTTHLHLEHDWNSQRLAVRQHTLSS